MQHIKLSGKIQYTNGRNIKFTKVHRDLLMEKPTLVLKTKILYYMGPKIALQAVCLHAAELGDF